MLNLKNANKELIGDLSNKENLVIPKNTKKELRILINKNKDFLIIIEENAELDLITNFEVNEDSKISFEIILKENAKLNYLNLQNLSLNIKYNEEKRVKLEKNSEFNYYDLNFGSKSIKSELIVNLDGENAKFEHYGIFVSDKKQEFDFGVNASHNAPYTYSNMLTKGVLCDSSKSNYRGLIKISKNAHNSNGYQKEDVILLSNDAEANVIPKLEIDNHDVRCTHGASISQLDQDKIFYLMTRGLDENQAKIELVNGFFQIILNKINFDNIEKIQGIIQDKIK
ncbi:MAG: Fe-S cluster assembly protein SufD [Nanoarchaeota archaeon]